MRRRQSPGRSYAPGFGSCLWWDSRRRVPDPGLLQRRHIGIASPIQPWLVPDSVMSEGLRAELDAACGGDRAPIAIANPSVREGIDLEEFVSLEIEVDDQLAKHEPFATRGRKLTQTDFPALVEVIREQARAEFGPRADLPE